MQHAWTVLHRLLQALSVGAEAAKLVTAAFPAEMELKFERMCLPFMLLHVNRHAWASTTASLHMAECPSSSACTPACANVKNVPHAHAPFVPQVDRKPEQCLRLVQGSMCDGRYAGRAFDNAEQLAEGKGSLLIKGLKSTWRQAAPIVRTTLHGAMTRILMQVCYLSSLKTPPALFSSPHGKGVQESYCFMVC